MKTIREQSGNRFKMQIRHMVMTIKKAYAYFGKEYTSLNVSKSKFYELRTKHVLLSSDMPHNVYVCEKHANFNFITEALSKKHDAFHKQEDY